LRTSTHSPSEAAGWNWISVISSGPAPTRANSVSLSLALDSSPAMCTRAANAPRPSRSGASAIETIVVSPGATAGAFTETGAASRSLVTSSDASAAPHAVMPAFASASWSIALPPGVGCSGTSVV
jgi:hypothetical protein